MRTAWMKGITVTAFGFLGVTTIGAGSARADIVSVQGTSRLDTIVSDPKLAEANLAFSENELVSFSFSYDTCTYAGTSQFVVTGATTAMNGDDAFASIFEPYTDPYTGISIDVFQAGGFQTRNGVFTSAILELQDSDRNLLALGPDAYLDMLGSWEDTRFLIGVASDDYPADGWGWRYLVEGDIDSISATVSAGPPCGGVNTDLDGDGVPNDQDKCASTETGTVVNADGCSVDDLVPCDGPLGGGAWQNHGEYMSTITQVVKAMFKAGLISAAERDALIGKAAASGCGH